MDKHLKKIKKILREVDAYNSNHLADLIDVYSGAFADIWRVIGEAENAKGK